MPEHRPHVVKPLAAVIQHRMLDHGTYNPGRAFRSQGQLLTVETILERIHFLFNDIRHLPQPPHKQPRGLDDGRADVAIGVAVHERTNLFLQPLPLRGV